MNSCLQCCIRMRCFSKPQIAWHAENQTRSCHGRRDVVLIIHHSCLGCRSHTPLWEQSPLTAPAHKLATKNSGHKAGKHSFHPMERAVQRLIIMSALQKYSLCTYRFEWCHGTMVATVRWDPWSSRTSTEKQAPTANELNLYRKD